MKLETISINEINRYKLGVIFTPQTKKDRFDNSINVLKNFYDNLMTLNHNIGYRVKDKTTNNFKKFMIDCKKDKIIDISLDGSNHTIYKSVHYNTIARYHHDLIHYNCNLDFSPKDEQKVAYIQMNEISRYMDKIGTCTNTQKDVLEIIYYDIIGQVLYYDKFKTFVNNQYTFVFDLFLNGQDITKEINGGSICQK